MAGEEKRYGEMPETVGRNSRADGGGSDQAILLARRARTSESARSMRAVEGQPDRSLMKKRPETWNFGEREQRASLEGALFRWKGTRTDPVLPKAAEEGWRGNWCGFRAHRGRTLGRCSLHVRSGTRTNCLAGEMR